MKGDDNPMDPDWQTALAAAEAAPRCRAHAKRTGEPCRAPALTGWRVCRMHGAGGGHKAGPSHPSWKHGMRAREWAETRRMMNDLVREARELNDLLR